jgi:hypothetical protein
MAEMATHTSTVSIPAVLIDAFRNAIGRWHRCRPRSFVRKSPQYHKVDLPTPPKHLFDEKDVNDQKPLCKILFFDSEDSEKRKIVEQVKVMQEHHAFLDKLGKTGVIGRCMEGGPPSVVETPFPIDRLNLDFCDIGAKRPLLRPKDWTRLFENVTGVVFVVNLVNYDQLLADDPSQSRLMQSLRHFEVMINSAHLRDTPIDLFMSNAEGFKRKLVTSPLEEYFPDYKGGNDVMKAAKYLLWRFTQVNRANRRIYPHLIGRDASASSEVLLAAVKQMALQGALSEYRLLEKNESKR